MTNFLRPHTNDYTVGWICALPIELAAAAELLDEEFKDLPEDTNDTNLTFGRVGDHKVVVACLPAGQTGTNSAAAVAIQMKSRFTSIRFALMVGVGGGVSSAGLDIRLGDVVISQPYMQHGGVIQYDFGKTGAGGRNTIVFGVTARHGPKKTRRGPKVQRGPNFKFNFGPRSALDHA
jgi:nucleoside phosphorylase